MLPAPQPRGRRAPAGIGHGAVKGVSASPARHSLADQDMFSSGQEVFRVVGLRWAARAGRALRRSGRASSAFDRMAIALALAPTL